MDKIKIIAKSAPTYEQAMAKIKAGFKNLEIQLLHGFLTEEEYKDTEKIIKEAGADILVVHTPLIKVINQKGKEVTEELSLVNLIDDEHYKMFCDTCKYVQYIANLVNHKVKIVIHNTFSVSVWKETKLLETIIGQKIKDAIKDCNDISFVVELSTTLDEKGFKSGFNMEDVSYAVKVLNEVVENRFETLLDTCHMMMNWEVWNRFTYDKLNNWDETFKDSTKYNKLGLIHLNNIRDNGLHEDHGVPFDINNKYDMEKLKQIMSAYEKYANCEITIEVREDDYNNTPYNLIKTKEALETLDYNLDLN